MRPPPGELLAQVIVRDDGNPIRSQYGPFQPTSRKVVSVIEDRPPDVDPNP